MFESMSKVRVAIVGCGYWGQNLIRNFAELPDVEVVAVCDFNLNTLARTKRRYPAVELRQDFHQILTDPQIQAVVIATPVSTHYPFASQALNHRKHVLVEKPLATSTRLVLDLMQLAEKQNRTLMVDHTFLYTGAVRRMRSIIDAGEIGELRYFDSVRISLGLVQSDTNVIWDLAPHDFSIMDYLCKETPTAISAMGAKHLGCAFENMAYVTAHFDTKMIAHFHVNWLAPVKVRKTLVGGTRKMILYDDMERVEKVRVYDRGVTVSQDLESRDRVLAGYRNGDMVAPDLDSSEALRLMARDFIDSITQRRLPICDGYAGYRIVRLLEAAQQSMQRDGRPIEVTDPVGAWKIDSSALAIVA
jgi:predicted dehydrogenase